jgi:hypothetical protein
MSAKIRRINLPIFPFSLQRQNFCNINGVKQEAIIMEETIPNEMEQNIENQLNTDENMPGTEHLNETNCRNKKTNTYA